MGCKKCGAPLDSDGVGATLRFIDRRAKDYFCVKCLAEELKTSEEYLRERIQFLKDSGCGMFPDSKKKK